MKIPPLVNNGRQYPLMLDKNAEHIFKLDYVYLYYLFEDEDIKRQDALGIEKIL